VPFIKLRPDVSFEEQLKALSVDSVFVDTFGVSPRDSEKILELKKQINFRDPVLRARLETHLALPVGMASGDLDRHMEAFRVLGPQYLLFTKWDETENWGGMLASILSYSIPVSFIGHGQEVPDDLSAFSSRDFAKTITRVDH
jgi:flagellar biosynthesis protein FlhF